MDKKEVYDFTDFIGKNSLSTLASCSTIVGVLVQAFKQVVPIHPLGLSFMFATIISILKLLLSGDYTKNNVILSVFNIIPISLTASGGYDLLNKISQ